MSHDPSPMLKIAQVTVAVWRYLDDGASTIILFSIATKSENKSFYICLEFFVY